MKVGCRLDGYKVFLVHLLPAHQAVRVYGWNES